MDMKKGDLGKAGLFTIGMGLITTGSGFLGTNQLTAGIACVGCGFGCVLLGIWWVERQITEVIVNKLKA